MKAIDGGAHDLLARCNKKAPGKPCAIDIDRYMNQKKLNREHTVQHDVEPSCQYAEPPCYVHIRKSLDALYHTIVLPMLFRISNGIYASLNVF